MSGPAALGVSDHSGWAVIAAVEGPPRSPTLLFCRRIQLCPDDLPRQAYHAVAEQGAPPAVIAQVHQAARELAGGVLRQAVADAPRLTAVAVAMGRTQVPYELPRILASHSHLHAAEGELYRDAFAEAADAVGLRLVRFLNKEVRSEAASGLGVPLPELETRLASMGKLAGPPWTKDEKDATAAAILALATISSH